MWGRAERIGCNEISHENIKGKPSAYRYVTAGVRQKTTALASRAALLPVPLLPSWGVAAAAGFLTRKGIVERPPAAHEATVDGPALIPDGRNIEPEHLKQLAVRSPLRFYLRRPVIIV